MYTLRITGDAKTDRSDYKLVFFEYADLTRCKETLGSEATLKNMIQSGVERKQERGEYIDKKIFISSV